MAHQETTPRGFTYMQWDADDVVYFHPIDRAAHRWETNTNGKPYQVRVTGAYKGADNKLWYHVQDTVTGEKFNAPHSRLTIDGINRRELEHNAKR